jgi:hypothetical protein
LAKGERKKVTTSYLIRSGSMAGTLYVYVTALRPSTAQVCHKLITPQLGPDVRACSISFSQMGTDQVSVFIFLGLT